MKKVHESKAEIAKTVEALNNLRLSINEFVQKYNALPGASIPNNEKLALVLHNPKNAYRVMIMEQMPDEEYGLKNDKEAKVRLLTLPNFDEVVDMAISINNRANQYGIDCRNGIFEMDGTNSVKINFEKRESALDRFRVYAKSNTEEKLIEYHKQFIEAYHNFRGYAESSLGKNNCTQLFDPLNFNMRLFIDDNGAINTELFNKLKVYVK